MSTRLLSPPESLYRALFPAENPQVIAAVGGGGKTTLLKTLAAELSVQGSTVIITTTTKMHLPDDPRRLATSIEAVAPLLKEHSIVWAGTPIGPEKMTGIPDALSALKAAADYVLVEADGSRKRPLKMTDPAYEPSIPPEADAVVAIAGLDALGKPVADAVHRSHLAASMLGLPEDAPVTPDIAARLLRYCYAPRIVLLNKADTPALRDQARQIADLLPEARCIVLSLRDWGMAENR